MKPTQSISRTEITAANVDILYESNGQVVATSGTVQGPNKW